MQNLPNLHLAVQDPFLPSELIDAIKLNAELEKYMEASAEVWEGYTIEEHTQMVLGVFEKYWVRFLSRKEKAFWRLFLLLHDIGKPISVAKYGDKTHQHETTWPVMKEVMEASECSKKDILQAQLLLSQDILGTYFKDKMSLKTAVHDVVTIQRKVGWTIEQTLFNLKMFFCCDAGGYTMFAGGTYSLDYLFEANEKNSTMELADEKNDRPEYQEFTTLGKFQILAAAASTASIAGKLP